jgi:hypothetical protein
VQKASIRQFLEQARYRDSFIYYGLTSTSAAPKPRAKTKPAGKQQSASPNQRAAPEGSLHVLVRPNLSFSPESVNQIVTSLDAWVNQKGVPKHLKVGFANAAYEIWEMMNEETRPKLSKKSLMPLF